MFGLVHFLSHKFLVACFTNLGLFARKKGVSPGVCFPVGEVLYLEEFILLD